MKSASFPGVRDPTAESIPKVIAAVQRGSPEDLTRQRSAPI